ncbi:MAG: hypothetical protein AAGH87_01875 [Pseudomonadota bacterium]
MAKDIAIGVIHGVGTQHDCKPIDSAERSYSAKLYQGLSRRLGKKAMARVAWREIAWADLLAKRQREYLLKIRKNTRWQKPRKLILENLSDAFAYQRTAVSSDADDGARRHNTYRQIHERVHEILARLEKDVLRGAPLILFAHSLGAHIMSNYIYDAQKAGAHGSAPFGNMTRVAQFVTFGCNIPLFLFSLPEDCVAPIKRPDQGLSPAPTSDRWWFNFYDKDDWLAYPLAEACDEYKAMVDCGELEEETGDVGNLLTSWNILSHNDYWGGRGFLRPAAKIVKDVMAAY